jgi:hypothetical protein
MYAPMFMLEVQRVFVRADALNAGGTPALPAVSSLMTFNSKFVKVRLPSLL